MLSIFNKFKSEKPSKKKATASAMACNKHAPSRWGGCNSDSSWDAKEVACDKEAGACGGGCGGGCGSGGCGGGCGGGGAK